MNWRVLILIWSTLLVALLFSILQIHTSLPDIFSWLRPHWVALVLLYWLMALPEHTGVVTAWMAGLLLDSVTGSLLGQHALGMVGLAWVGLSFYERLRMYSILQQALVVLFAIALLQMLNLAIDVLARNVEWTFSTLLPSLSSALIWPALFVTLRSLRRYVFAT